MKMNKLTRRDFIKFAALGLTGTAVTCSGLAYIATLQPALSEPKLSFGKDTTMNKRILITYATRAGSTPEIAAVIGETLAARGYSVDVKAVKSCPALNGYDAVLLGSPIRMNKWLPEMLDYIKANQAALAALPVALFTAHMLNTGDDESSRTARSAYTASLREYFSPVDEVFFTGKIDFDTLSFFDRLIAKAVGKQSGIIAADLRNWEKIQDWAKTVPA